MKGKIYIIFFIIFSLLLVKSSLAAGEIELSLNVKSLTIYTGETGIAEISVKNNQASQDTLSVSVFPQYIYGIIPTLDKYSLTLDANSVTTFKIYFNVPECSEEASTSFTITVNSQKNTNVEESKTILLNTIRKYGICISDLKLDKYIVNPGENVSIEATLSNPAESLSLPVALETNVIKDNEIVKTFSDSVESIEGKSSKTVKHIFSVNKYENPGFYTVEVIMKDRFGSTVGSKKTQFRIPVLNASENSNYLLINKETKFGLLAQTVEINVKNDGNVPIENSYVSESIPLFMKIFFFPKEEPISEEIKENRIIYTWLVPSLAPGEGYIVSYEISTWNAVLIIAVLAITVFYVFNYAFAISVVKKHSHFGQITKEKEITVMLEVRNRTRNEIRDVVVRDFVPGVAMVVEKFDTLRPMLRKVGSGTEVVWRFDVLGPGDERTLTYRIKPVMEIIGTLKLPKAYVRFMDKRKEVKRILSKGVYVKAG